MSKAATFGSPFCDSFLNLTDIEQRSPTLSASPVMPALCQLQGVLCRTLTLTLTLSWGFQRVRKNMNKQLRMFWLAILGK